MRTIKELLVIVRDNLKDNTESIGLCAFIYQLSSYDVISNQEYFILMNYLDNNIPLTFNVIGVRILEWEFKEPVTTYWWDYNNRKARTKWLNKQINKL